MPLYIGRKKVCPIVPTWRGFWSVTVYGFPGTIVDCGIQKTIGEDGKAVFRFAEAGTYTFIGMKGTETDVKEIELVEGEYFVQLQMYGKELEYISSEDKTSGRPYIDLGIVPTGKEKVEIEFQLNDVLTAWEIVFGSRTSSNSNGFTFMYINNTWTYLYDKTTYNALAHDFNKHTIIIDAGKLYYDGVRKTSYATTTIAPKQTALLFGMHSNDEGGLAYGNYKIFKFKMWDANGELIYDLVPLKDADGKGCMFNKVDGRVLYSSNAAAFVPGPEVA